GTCITLSLLVAVMLRSLLRACFFFHRSADHRALHSFPTRRSSDLNSFIKPVIKPTLSEFCTKLTGISQQDVDSVPTFKDAITALDRKSTRLNSSHVKISYAVFCLKKKTKDKCYTHSHYT